MEQAGRSVKGQFKQADRLGARSVLIVGADALSVRDMKTGDQTEVPDLAEALAALQEVLA
jgi:histidyl-tRNA synthetase